MQRTEKLPKDRAGGSPSMRRTVEGFSRAAETASLARGKLVEGARRILRARAGFSKGVNKGALRDSAWPVLLELFVSGEEGATVFVKHLVIASGETVATATRLLDRLEAADLIARRPDPLDQRRVIVTLTPRGRADIIAMLSHIFDPVENLDIPATPVSYQARKAVGTVGTLSKSID